MGKRFYRKPKWGWRLPGPVPHPKSSAAKRHRVPRALSRKGEYAYSNTRLQKTEKWVSGRGGGVGRFLARILRKLDRKRHRRMRPPDNPKTYTIDVK